MKKQSIEALTLAENPASTTTDLARALDLGRWDHEVHALVLKHPAASERILRLLFATIAEAIEDAVCSDIPDKNPQLLAAAVALAAHPRAEPAMLATLSEVRVPAIRRATAANPLCPDAILLSLIEDADPAVSAAACGNPKLAGGGPAAIRGFAALQAAKNARTSASDLEKLGDHPHPMVRLALARNPSTPGSTLPSLFQARPDDSAAQTESRRRALLTHPHVTDSLAKTILDSDLPGASNVLGNPALSPGFLAANAVDHPWSVAANPVCPAKALEDMTRQTLNALKKLNEEPVSGDEDDREDFRTRTCGVFSLLCSLAENRNTPASCLAKIRITMERCTDASRRGIAESVSRVTSALEKNPGTPRGLKYLAFASGSLVGL